MQCHSLFHVTKTNRVGIFSEKPLTADDLRHAKQMIDLDIEFLDEPDAQAMEARMNTSSSPDATYIHLLERAVIELNEGGPQDRDGLSADTEILVVRLDTRRADIMGEPL